MKRGCCKDCQYCSEYYGTKDRSGKPTISKYWCTRRNGSIKKWPKACSFKEGREK